MNTHYSLFWSIPTCKQTTVEVKEGTDTKGKIELTMLAGKARNELSLKCDISARVLHHNVSALKGANANAIQVQL